MRKCMKINVKVEISRSAILEDEGLQPSQAEIKL